MAVPPLSPTSALSRVNPRIPEVLKLIKDDAIAALLTGSGIWQIADMDQEHVIAKLREHELELKASGIVHLRLHGSVARGEASETSDVDLIAEFDSGRRLSLLDMVGLENRLVELLGVPVDLSPPRNLKEPVREKAGREAGLAF